MRRQRSVSPEALVKAAEVYSKCYENGDAAMSLARNCLSLATRTDRRELWIDVIAALPHIVRRAHEPELGDLPNLPIC